MYTFVLEPAVLWSSILLVILLYVTRSIFLRTKEEREIHALGSRAPKVRTLPFGIDFVIKAVRAEINHQNLEFWEHLFSTFGTPASPYTAEIRVAGLRTIFTAEPENIKAILTSQFADYGKGEPFHEDWKDFLGDSIFTTDKETWHHSRQLIRPQFIKDRVSDLQIFERHVSKLINMVGGNGEEVEISGLFFRYTLDAATEFLLGRSVNSLENPQTEFADAFAEVQRTQGIIARAGPLNPLVPRRKFWAGLKVINAFVQPFIEQALRLSQTELEQKTKSDEGYTFLHALASFTRDRKTIRDQLIAVLLAGRDTTAASLSWIFYELSCHPEVVAKIRQEVLDRIGPYKPPTYEDLKSMRYLQHTMNESLRLYPGVPFNVRLALHDTTLPLGGGPDGLQPIGIRKNTPIGYSTLFMQRRRDLYPSPSPPEFPDITTFCPDRWDHWSPKSWQYIPFNGGPRICVGQQFALTEMGYTIVRILQRFERVESYWQGAPVLKSEIVLQPGFPVNIGFRRRREDC